jgi:hypothetical protein
MSIPKKKPTSPQRAAAKPPAKLPGAAPSSRLRAQTRKVLGKHYRSKYGVR